MGRGAAALLLWLAVAACGPGPRAEDDQPDPPDAPPVPTIDGPPIEPLSRVYAHSGNQLYRIDTATLEPEVIGSLTGLGTQSLTDLAIDRDDRMVGITLDKLVSVDPTTGATTLIRDLSESARGFTSLSFVPLDLDDPTSTERLVAANDQGEVFEIDPTTGEATALGSYGTVAAGTVRSSGDLIAVRGFGIFATVTIGDALSDPDYLARINPSTWRATPLGTGTDYDRIFGLGFWAGTIYGFVDGGATAGNGSFIRLDPDTGASELIEAGDIRWYGAGVATDAPIIE